MKQGYKLTAYILLAFWAGYEINNNKVSEMQKKVNVFANTKLRNEIHCPNADDALVLIGFGQSNSANSAGHRSKATTKNIVNFFNGKCYEAVDPLLGATGRQGNVWIPIAEKLQSDDKTVVLATFGVGGSSVEQWLDENYLLPFYKKNVSSLKQYYPNPNSAVWIQGESDKKTSNEKFESSLKKWLGIVKADFPNTNLYLTGTSYCNGSANPQVLVTQEKLIKAIGGIYIGSTDVLTSVNLRYDDCHFSEQGINALTEIISAPMIK